MVVMLDAYIDRADGAAGPEGASVADIDRCDWIVVGHAHFDHLFGAERILAATDARLIASYESVRVMVDAGVPEDRMIPVAGGETVALSDDVVVEVFPSLHSCVWSHTQMAQPHQECLGDLGVTWQEQQERLQELMAALPAQLSPAGAEHVLGSMIGHSRRGDGGALVFRFVTPEGTLLYQDTSGHWSGIIDAVPAEVAILAAAGRANVDGQPVQGSLIDFLVAEVDAIGPDTTILCHHDDWLPGFSVPTEMAPIRDRFATLPTQLLELDYCAPTEVLPAPIR